MADQLETWLVPRLVHEFTKARDSSSILLNGTTQVIRNFQPGKCLQCIEQGLQDITESDLPYGPKHFWLSDSSHKIRASLHGDARRDFKRLTRTSFANGSVGGFLTPAEAAIIISPVKSSDGTSMVPRLELRILSIQRFHGNGSADVGIPKNVETVEPIRSFFLPAEIEAKGRNKSMQASQHPETPSADHLVSSPDETERHQRSPSEGRFAGNPSITTSLPVTSIKADEPNSAQTHQLNAHRRRESSSRDSDEEVQSQRASSDEMAAPAPAFQSPKSPNSAIAGNVISNSEKLSRLLLAAPSSGANKLKSNNAALLGLLRKPKSVQVSRSVQNTSAAPTLSKNSEKENRQDVMVHESQIAEESSNHKVAMSQGYTSTPLHNDRQYALWDVEEQALTQISHSTMSRASSSMRSASGFSTKVHHAHTPTQKSNHHTTSSLVLSPQPRPSPTKSIQDFAESTSSKTASHTALKDLLQKPTSTRSSEGPGPSQKPKTDDTNDTYSLSQFRMTLPEALEHSQASNTIQKASETVRQITLEKLYERDKTDLQAGFDCTRPRNIRIAKDQRRLLEKEEAWNARGQNLPQSVIDDLQNFARRPIREPSPVLAGSEESIDEQASIDSLSPDETMAQHETPMLDFSDEGDDEQVMERAMSPETMSLSTQQPEPVMSQSFDIFTSYQLPEDQDISSTSDDTSNESGYEDLAPSPNQPRWIDNIPQGTTEDDEELELEIAVPQALSTKAQHVTDNSMSEDVDEMKGVIGDQTLDLNPSVESKSPLIPGVTPPPASPQHPSMLAATNLADSQMESYKHRVDEDITTQRPTKVAKMVGDASQEIVGDSSTFLPTDDPVTSNKDSAGTELQGLNPAASISDNVFEAYKAAYPDYECDLRAFVKSCAYIEWLLKVKQAPHPFLWDDLIRTYSTEYIEYAYKETTGTRDDTLMTGLEFFNTKVVRPRYVSSIVSRSTLSSAISIDRDLATELRARFSSALISRSSQVITPRAGTPIETERVGELLSSTSAKDKSITRQGGARIKYVRPPSERELASVHSDERNKEFHLPNGGLVSFEYQETHDAKNVGDVPRTGPHGHPSPPSNNHKLTVPHSSTMPSTDNETAILSTPSSQVSWSPSPPPPKRIPSTNTVAAKEEDGVLARASSLDGKSDTSSRIAKSIISVQSERSSPVASFTQSQRDPSKKRASMSGKVFARTHPAISGATSINAREASFDWQRPVDRGRDMVRSASPAILPSSPLSTQASGQRIPRGSPLTGSGNFRGKSKDWIPPRHRHSTSAILGGSSSALGTRVASTGRQSSLTPASTPFVPRKSLSGNESTTPSAISPSSTMPTPKMASMKLMPFSEGLKKTVEPETQDFSY